MTQPPILLFIVGPGAVGKMAVGHEITQRTGMPLFHNHVSIEPALRIFRFSDPRFKRLVEAHRTVVFEEVANSDLPGLIFTYIWAFDLASDNEAVERYSAPFRARAGRVLFLELEAPLEERLRRNETSFRLAEKPSKRDVAGGKRVILEHDKRYRMTSNGQFDGRDDWLRVDNTDIRPEVVADLVINHFELPRLSK